jgi:uncharacterized ferredoxin-like protein
MKKRMIRSDEAEEEAIMSAAKTMCVAARTAPKAKGVDDVSTLILCGTEKDKIAAKMEEIAEERVGRSHTVFKRDARNLKESKAVILIGVRGGRSTGLDCGGCGFSTCKNFEHAEKKRGKDFFGPNCVFKLLDLGISLCSAVKTASLLNVDNLMMFTVGSAAVRLRLMPEASLVIGVPVSAYGKNIYFDRKK